MLENVFYDKHANDLDFVWETFQRVEKDVGGGLTPGIPLDNFVTAYKKIDPAMYGIIKMLTTGNFNSASLWSLEGYCVGSALNYFHGFLLQSLYLKSMAIRVQGFELKEENFKEFIDNIEETKMSHDKSCFGKFINIISPLQLL